MTSRAPSIVAAIVPKFSAWLPSGRAEARGTPVRVTTAEATAPVRSFRIFRIRCSSPPPPGPPDSLRGRVEAPGQTQRRAEDQQPGHAAGADESTDAVEGASPRWRR